ncbi:MAG TPA: O-methyltransferase [Acidisarcina sp.]|nr:O-methyltransferase [Acidisarcina sp.]
MNQEQWTAVEHYIADQVVKKDEVLDAVIAASDAAGMPAIQISPNHGKLLNLLVRMNKARSILEIGTLAGYSTIWMARGLPADGRLITLEFEPKHAAVARANMARAGLADRVEVRVGAALKTLPLLAAERLGPFDLIFIDADKGNYPGYFEWAMKLARKGSLIVADNAVQEGRIADASCEDSNVKGIRRFIELLSAEPRVSATILQTVGSHGYDGLAIGLVTSD